MGENGGTNIIIVMDRVLYNVVYSVTFRALLKIQSYRMITKASGG